MVLGGVGVGWEFDTYFYVFWIFGTGILLQCIEVRYQAVARVGGWFFAGDVGAGEVDFHQYTGLGTGLKVLEVLAIVLAFGGSAGDGDYDGFFDVRRFRVAR